MTILSSQTIRRLGLLSPFCDRTTHIPTNTSFGLSSCGYDIRLDQDILIRAGEFCLASSIERFHMPTNIMGRPCDKSTWARRGLVIQNTVVEPGWSGHLTLELTNHSLEDFYLVEGTPIAQIIFEFLDEATEQPYTGKYQNQGKGPQGAR